MRRFLTFCSLVILLLTISTSTPADIAKPTPAPQKEGRPVLHTGLEIAVDPKGSDARLQIRESDFKELVASRNGTGANGNLATTVTANPARTIVAGVLLFVSLSFAGVWFARTKRTGMTLGRGQKTAVIGLLLVSMLGAAAVITRGNAGPPPYYRWRNLADNLKNEKSTTGSVNIEVVPDSTDGGPGIKLIIPLRK